MTKERWIYWRLVAKRAGYDYVWDFFQAVQRELKG